MENGSRDPVNALVRAYCGKSWSSEGGGRLKFVRACCIYALG